MLKERQAMKPRFVIVVFIILALAAPATMLAQGGKDEKEVRAAVEGFRQADLKGGAEAAAFAEKYLADEYMRITPDGRVFAKAEALDGVRTGKTRYQSVELSEIKIRVYGRTAVATGITRAKGMTMGVPTGPGSRFTRVFVKRGGVWQTVLYQTTRIAQ